MRGRLLLWAALLIGCGLGLTFLKLPLPAPVRHFGGSFLWGAMLLLLVQAARPPAAASWPAAPASVLIAACVELLRLVHTPLLDDARRSFTGGLLLGRVFNPWNIVAYWAGIASAWGICRIDAGPGRRVR